MARGGKDLALDVGTVGLFVVAVIASVVNAFSKPPFTGWTWATLVLSVISAGIGLFIYFRKGRLEKSFILGKEDGFNQALERWAIVAAAHEDGVDNANRQRHSEAIDSFLKAMIATFEAFFVGNDRALTASLAVVSGDQTTLWLVKIEPGGKGRSSPMPRPYPLTSTSWGMLECYQRNQIVYTADVRINGNAGDRGYLSVVNMPVRNAAGTVIGVVNIDSPSVDAFINEERIKQAYGYSLPILSSISLSLADPRVFRQERA